MDVFGWGATSFKRVIAEECSMTGEFGCYGKLLLDLELNSSGGSCSWINVGSF